MSHSEFTVALERDQAFAFTVTFAGADLAPLIVDELPPTGGGAGPNPTRMLAAAIGHCLSASLLFCLSRAQVAVSGLDAHVTGRIERNPAGRLRVADLRVELMPRFADDPGPRVDRCLEVFEDYCIVTQSVRRGIDVNVTVTPQVPAGQAGST